MALRCAGGRKDERILVWDMRAPDEPVGVYSRPCRTNQKIGFDVDGAGVRLRAFLHSCCDVDDFVPERACCCVQACFCLPVAATASSVPWTCAIQLLPLLWGDSQARVCYCLWRVWV